MLQSHRPLLLLLASLQATAAGIAAAQEVDTSEWACELCPFSQGYDGDIEVGMTSASDDSAYLGDATGYDESGVYGNLGGQGSWSGASYFMRWSASDLLLDSRVLDLTGGQPGNWDYRLSLRQLPRREYFSTETVFAQDAGDYLALPANWVSAPLTTGFANLDSSLAGVDISADRSALGVGGRYFITPHINATLNYRRYTNDGNRVLGGPSFTTASLLPAPFDYLTDEFDLRLEYQGKRAYVAVAWLLSEFSSEHTGLAWESPFTVLPGAETGELAQPPDNRLQQFTLRGGYVLPFWGTTLSGSLALGEITQDTPFLAYTTNAGIPSDPLPRASLDGSVDTSHVAASLSSRPLPKARLRLTYRYDERDNNTERLAWNRVIVDSFVSGAAEMNTPYSYDRSRLAAMASYDLFSMLRVSGGVERRDVNRDYQEVAEQTEDIGWLGLRWHFSDWFSLEGRGGTAKRDIDRYDESVAASLRQNPLLRKYELAYRYREFADFSVAMTPFDWPVTLTLNGMYADDSYTKSRLGMLNAEEFQLAADLTWAVNDQTSWYIDIGGDSIESRQSGSESFAEPDWWADYKDRFVTFGSGLRVRQIADKIDLRIDYRTSDGVSEMRVDSSAGDERFPDFETRYEDVRVGLDYRWSPRLLLEFDLSWQTFETDDWMLDGVGPATIPAVLSLGAKPWDDRQFLFGVGFRYDLAAPDVVEE